MVLSVGDVLKNCKRSLGILLKKNTGFYHKYNFFAALAKIFITNRLTGE